MKGQCVAAALLVLGGLGNVRAQDYPARTVTIIVPFAPGGPADVTGRIVADIFSRHLGQQFVVANVGGAGGTIGSLRAARATADGYTIISGHMGTHAAAPFFYPNLGYDPEKDFEPIGLIAEQPELLAVRKDFPANNLKEFIAYAKANESKLNMGHAGRWLGVLYRLPSSQLGHRHQAGDGAVQRHGACHERNPRRTSRLRLRSGAGTAAPCARGHRQGACHRDKETKPAAARRADVL
jgi:hypothetical protein